VSGTGDAGMTGATGTRPVVGDVAAGQAGSSAEAGPTTQAGPLGRVDPVTPSTPGVVLRPSLGPATLTVVAGIAGLVATLVVLGSLAQAIRAQEVLALDAWATPFLHGIASPGLDRVMEALTTLGSSLVIVPAFLVVMAFLAWRRRFGAALFLGLASGGALVIDGTMKLFFQRPRPQLPWAQVLPDYSFPSGHTMNGFVFFVALALITWSVFGRRAGVLALAAALILAVGIGMSRIYLGFHYLTDVVGGVLAGTAWLLVAGAAIRARPTWRRWRGAAPTPGAGRPEPNAGEDVR
jgi:undecaprenyl-diphosphatase